MEHEECPDSCTCSSVSILRCRCNVGNCGRLVARDDGPSYVSYDRQRKASPVRFSAWDRTGSTSQILFVGSFLSLICHVCMTQVVSWRPLKHSEVYVYDKKYAKQHLSYARERHIIQRDFRYAFVPLRKTLASASK